MPEYKRLTELEQHYQRGGLGDGTVKKFLNAILQEELQPIRERRQFYQANIELVYNILEDGSKEARKVAAETLKKVRRAIGIEYFDDAELKRTYQNKYNNILSQAAAMQKKTK